MSASGSTVFPAFFWRSCASPANDFPMLRHWKANETRPEESRMAAPGQSVHCTITLYFTSAITPPATIAGARNP